MGKHGCLYCGLPIDTARWAAGQRFCFTGAGVPSHRWSWQARRSVLVGDALERFSRGADAVSAWKTIERTLQRVRPPQPSICRVCGVLLLPENIAKHGTAGRICRACRAYTKRVLRAQRTEAERERDREQERQRRSTPASQERQRIAQQRYRDKRRAQLLAEKAAKVAPDDR